MHSSGNEINNSSTMANQEASTVTSTPTADPTVAVHACGLGTRCPYFGRGPDAIRIDQLGIPVRLLNFEIPSQRVRPTAPVVISDVPCDYPPVAQASYQPLTPVESSCTSAGPQQISDSEDLVDNPLILIDTNGTINVGTVTLKPRPSREN